jgi:hydrogenase/urease accessory protein HupE
MIRLLAGLACLLWAFGAQAHELRPGYLEIQETAPDLYELLWKVPARGEFRLSLGVALPEICIEDSPVVRTRTDNAFVDRWRVRCDGGLQGSLIGVEGLSATYTDVIMRLERLDGTVQTARLAPDFPQVKIASAPTAAATAQTYFLLGVQHITLGLDHLLFVFALLLLIRDVRTLVATITSFTVAHSITLAFAALGRAAAPQPPVEALIALSIAFVAAEIIRKDRGQSGFSNRNPWSIAFLFGLLHGFGFGGALKEIGLPQKDVPLALLTFNLGVEAGQLAFVAVTLAAIASLKLLLDLKPGFARIPVAYAIGTISAAWFVQRVFSF